LMIKVMRDPFGWRARSVHAGSEVPAGQLGKGRRRGSLNRFKDALSHSYAAGAGAAQTPMPGRTRSERIGAGKEYRSPPGVRLELHLSDLATAEPDARTSAAAPR
jgi:hypothetical protein